MTMSIINQLRRSVRHMACNNPLYHWSLGGIAPERLLIKPVDVWPGNVESGHWLCDGAFTIDEDHLTTGLDCWEPIGVDAIWLEHMHGFSWLRDLRAVGGQDGRRQARAMIESWMYHYRRWHELTWRADITGERLSMWIAHFDFYDEVPDFDDESFRDEFFDSLARQARHIAQALPSDLHGTALLKGIKGLLYAGLALEGREVWVAKALSLLDEQMPKQILRDGAHASRNPAELLTALRILLDIRTALNASEHPLPESIQHAIDRMVPALRFFRYGDKGFGVFNGAQEGHIDEIDAVLAQAGVRSKAVSSLPCAGYERAALGRTVITFDCGRSASYPYDDKTHAAPLAFEMTYGKDRVLVSCGSHPSCSEWQDALRGTAAHNTLTLDHRNACEIKEHGHFARKVRAATSLRDENKEMCLLEGSHDGYVPLFGITHKRRIYLGDQGCDVRGEDTLSSQVGIQRPLDWAIRFHIHPRVLVSLIRDKTEALLRLQSGVGWRFHHSGGFLALEDSIYLGSGSQPRKTKQLVIYGQIFEDIQKIKWALQREGGA